MADVAWQTPHDGRKVAVGLESTVLTIEIDDDGAFHQPEQRSNMENWLRKNEEKPLLLYVHGWHHNAKKGNCNLVSFTNFLARIEEQSGTSVLGLYVGWRGDSVDVAFLPELIDFFTIWGRKSASRDVGENGLREILDHIRGEYPNRRVFAMGHSLGGSALFHALKSDLQDTFDDGYEYLLMNPAASDAEVDEARAELRRLALMRSRMTESGTNIEEAMRDYRKMLVLQALGDRAVGIFYRIAFLGSTPVGFKKDLITHNAFACDIDVDCERKRRSCDLYLAKNDRFAIEAVSEDLKGCESDSAEEIWVATGEDSVSRDHNDIFNGVQSEAIIYLVARTFNLTLSN
ncbi:MAG: hypothetical protein QNJ05_10965 [Woeseiaceae bacterium]|nr:hypothetical protein [Woeseiaceae bacterium]